jgi:thiamine monophosphate kinase
VPAGLALTRSGAVPGDGLYVCGDLGGAAACVRAAYFVVGGTLLPAQQRN